MTIKGKAAKTDGFGGLLFSGDPRLSQFGRKNNDLAKAIWWRFFRKRLRLQNKRGSAQSREEFKGMLRYARIAMSKLFGGACPSGASQLRQRETGGYAHFNELQTVKSKKRIAAVFHRLNLAPLGAQKAKGLSDFSLSPWKKWWA